MWSYFKKRANLLLNSAPILGQTIRQQYMQKNIIAASDNVRQVSTDIQCCASVKNSVAPFIEN